MMMAFDYLDSLRTIEIRIQIKTRQAQHLRALEQSLLALGGGGVPDEGQRVLIAAVLVQKVVQPADGLGRAAQLAAAHGLFPEVDLLEADAALLEPALRLAGVAALFCAEDLDVHGVSPSRSSAK